MVRENNIMSDSVSWWIKATEYAGFLLALFGVNKIMNYSLGKRVSTLEQSEEKHPRRKETDCIERMNNCPVKATIDQTSAIAELRNQAFINTMKDIADSQNQIRSEIQREFELHRALHLQIATEIGKLLAREKPGKNGSSTALDN